MDLAQEHDSILLFPQIPHIAARKHFKRMPTIFPNNEVLNSLDSSVAFSGSASF